MRVCREDVIGRTIAEILTSGVALFGERLVRVDATGEPEQYEREYCGCILLNKFRIALDEIAAAAIDITHLKQAEEDVRAANERLREAGSERLRQGGRLVRCPWTATGTRLNSRRST